MIFRFVDRSKIIRRATHRSPPLSGSSHGGGSVEKFFQNMNTSIQNTKNIKQQFINPHFSSKEDLEYFIYTINDLSEELARLQGQVYRIDTIFTTQSVNLVARTMLNQRRDILMRHIEDMQEHIAAYKELVLEMGEISATSQGVHSD